MRISNRKSRLSAIFGHKILQISLGAAAHLIFDSYLPQGGAHIFDCRPFRAELDRRHFPEEHVTRHHDHSDAYRSIIGHNRHSSSEPPEVIPASQSGNVTRDDVTCVAVSGSGI